MERLFASGHVADLLVALLALELAVLWWWRRRSAAGLAPGRALPFLLAGVAFALALRTALTGAWWGWTALALAGAGAAHLWDLRSRWVSSGPAGDDGRSRR
jgi:hypothetical protein